MPGWRKSTPALLAALLLQGTPAMSAEEEAWFENDPYEKALAVSEGELRFLASPPAKPVHHHQNRIEITGDSLRDGWVRLYQCHSDIDPVASSQILFREGRVRELRVEGFDRIASARAEGHSVQLEQVEPGARLCLSAETLALHVIGGGQYELRNGPYMRRFLDGYYPMRLSMDVRYPSGLRLVDASPSSQPGVVLQEAPGSALLDTWFEGILHTRFRFVDRP